MDVQTANTLAYGSLLLAGIAILIVLANPYRLQRLTRETLGALLPTGLREEMLTLADAWAGRMRISKFQINLLSYGGLCIGVLVSLVVAQLLSPLLALAFGVVLSLLLFLLPRRRFENGFPKTLIEGLEREAPVVAAFMHRSVGITGLSVQISCEQFLEVYTDKYTSLLMSQVPDGLAYPDALLSLGLPSAQLNNWMQIMQVLASIGDFGDPEATLRDVRDRIRKREEQYLRMIIKRKAFAAPAATVVLMLPGLLCVLLGSIGIQAYIALVGGF